MSFADWSTTAGANTSVGGISIAENCPPSNLNNAIREVMAELRAAINPAMDPLLAATSIANALTALGALAKAGDTINGDLIRQGKGIHFRHRDPSYTSADIIVTGPGDPAPSGTDGDLWISLS